MATAESSDHVPRLGGSSRTASGWTAPPRRVNYNQLHAQPLPLIIHPLPVLIPHNPLSVLHVIWSYLVQVWSRPSSHPAELYKAYFSALTRSVHVVDPIAIRALWEKGFFGKGNLSRSEPTWVEREQNRQGLARAETSEDVTRKRREERKEFKKERARREHEAIEKQRLDERGTQAHAPSTNDSVQSIDAIPAMDGTPIDELPSVDREPRTLHGRETLSSGEEPLILSTTHLGDADPSSHDKCQKSGKEVRFAMQNASDDTQSRLTEPSGLGEVPVEIRATPSLLNQEHLQLTLEEALFLSYGLGVLEIRDEADDVALPPASLFALFRQHSYFPPRTSETLRMDDPFILSYVVYHHFRSLGWVIRPGIKFGVDYLLYNRGPVFSHAEFAIVILPSYDESRPAGSAAEQGARRESKPWWWLHGVNRVQSQVRKSLLLVFVEVPPPTERGGLEGCDVVSDVGAFLKKYKVREMNVKRWLPNRSRD